MDKASSNEKNYGKKKTMFVTNKTESSVLKTHPNNNSQTNLVD
jgi:hypothetical protein